MLLVVNSKSKNIFEYLLPVSVPTLGRLSNQTIQTPEVVMTKRGGIFSTED